VTFNEFLPEDRGIGECISAVPRPGCGSEARGGWRQTLVLVAILAGLILIAWRVVAGARKARAAQDRRVGAGH
jgi:cyanate permease